uniref:LRRCT domain-containing protein n=1 Tax=Phasianus colchicus TaxID=9054 RepID=A0A669PQ33_PHACC
MLVIRLSVVIKLFFQLEASVCPEKCDCSFKNAIHCSGPHITDLESLNLPCNMTKIHITDTNVTYVQDVFSGMGELQHLILSSNNIALISPEAFKGLRRLKALKLLDNNLVELPPEVFNDTVQLQQLIIENNRLKSIQENLFDRLSILNLSRNSLAVLPRNIFSALTKLEKLMLYFNRLSSIESGIFDSLRELLELFLLQVLPRSLFRNLKHLQKVYLNSTKLQSLPEDLFTTLPELQEVYLDDNPWKCDCQILGFREWLQKSTEVVKEAQSLMCDSPLSLRNISLLALTDHHLKCLPTTAITYQMFKSTYSQTSTSLTMEHLKSSWETVTAVSDLDTSTPTSVPVERATPGFTYSHIQDIEGSGSHFLDVPTQTSPSIIETNSVRGTVLTTPAQWDELPAYRSTQPYFNTRIACCQIFLAGEGGGSGSDGAEWYDVSVFVFAFYSQPQCRMCEEEGNVYYHTKLIEFSSILEECKIDAGLDVHLQ